MTLNVTIARVRVRTGACPQVQRKPSTDVLADVAGLARRRGTVSVTIRETSQAPSATQTAWITNGNAIPSANSAAPIGGPTIWLAVIIPAMIRALPMPRSRFSTTIGSSVLVVVSAKTSAVPSRNIAPSTTAMLTTPVTMVAASAASTSGPGGVHRDDQHPAVEPVGQRAGVQAEEQPRQPLQQDRQGDQERGVGLGGDQQRAGRERQAVADVGDPRRGQQPSEVPAQAGRSDGFDDPIHKTCTRTSPAPFPSPRRGRPRQSCRGRERRRTPRASATAAPTRPAGSTEESESGESLPRVTPGVGVAPMPSPGRSTT